VNTLVINEGELRYELRDKNSKITDLVKNLSKKISTKNIVVTSGMQGATAVNCTNGSATSCPAFNQNNIDTVGAGDTFFAVCALSTGAKIDTKTSMLMASISASFAINQLGKKYFFTDKILKKHLTHIFK
jgi:bifunctional ADP-heptose synthase (sugar kinase/adenylyltransferase)